MSEITTYIVYAKEDNEAVARNKQPWVDTFRRLLSHMCSQVSNRQNSIHLVSTDELSEGHIIEEGHYIIIISPQLFSDSLNTQWRAILEQVSGRNIEIFKAIKSPVNSIVEPDWLKFRLEYNFYKKDENSGSIEEVTDFFSEEAEKGFWLSLTDLTYDLMSTKLPKDTLCVYLANTSEDFAKRRSVVKRELQRHGYRVLPDRMLPTDSQELSEQMERDMQNCCMSIHMIGENYGQLLNDLDISVVEYQNLEASKYSKKLEAEGRFFKRYIWLPNNELLADERQRFYIDRLNRNTEKQHGSEFLQNHIEDFKTVLLNYLEAEKKEDRTFEEEDVILSSLNTTNRGKLLYLIVDQRDEHASIPMKEWLDSQGYQVLRTDLASHRSGNARVIHQRNLNLCDGLIIFFSRATEAWLVSKLQDILKSPGMGRTVPLDNKAIFTDSEENEKRLESIQEKNLQYQDALVILNKGEFSPASLESFLLNLPKSQEERYQD